MKTGFLSLGIARISVGRKTRRVREAYSRMFRSMLASSASMDRLGWTSNSNGFCLSLSSKNSISNQTLRIKSSKSPSMIRMKA